MSYYFTEEVEGVLIFGETALGRLVAASIRACVAFGGTSLIIGFVLIPDYFFRYRQTTPKSGLFFLSIALIAALVAFAFGLSRWARRERWILDSGQRALVLERSVFGQTRGQETLDLTHVTRWQVAPGAFGRGLVLRVWLGADARTENVLKLVGGWGGGESLKTVFERIEAYCKKKKLRMRFESESA